jgi:hypothetical protein
MLMKWHSGWFRFIPTSRPAKARRTALHVEALEDRTVPTVVVQPHFAGTTLTSTPAASQYSLDSVPVVLIFAGSGWQTAQGQQDQRTLTSDITTLLASPYLSGLRQYGSDGKASAFATTNAATPLALQGNYPTFAALRQYVSGQTNGDPGLVPPAGTDPRQHPLYFVINDPADSGPNWNYNGLNASYGNGLHAAYVGTGTLADGSFDFTDVTGVFSHEIVEAMVSSVAVNDPGNLRGGSQVCDNEPENGAGYLFPVGGVMAQAYWSQRDHGWIAPDGSATTTRLTPIWAGGSFTGFYANATGQPAAGSAQTIVARQNTFIITTGGALWERVGTTWTDLANGGVTGVSVGKDSAGHDALFVNFGGELLELHGTSPAADWIIVWDGGIGTFSASQVKADTVFVSYYGDLEEHTGLVQDAGWITLLGSGVTGVDAAVDGSGKPAVFVNVGGDLREHVGTDPDKGWTDLGGGVTAFRASQVQANTVFVSYGTDLWEHTGRNASIGWTELETDGVTSFSAGVDQNGLASIFLVLNGGLKEHTGTDQATGWHTLATQGVTAVTASQNAANTVFVFSATGLRKHTGLNRDTGWSTIL